MRALSNALPPALSSAVVCLAGTRPEPRCTMRRSALPFRADGRSLFPQWLRRQLRLMIFIVRKRRACSLKLRDCLRCPRRSLCPFWSATENNEHLGCVHSINDNGEFSFSSPYPITNAQIFCRSYVLFPSTRFPALALTACSFPLGADASPGSIVARAALPGFFARSPVYRVASVDVPVESTVAGRSAHSEDLARSSAVHCAGACLRVLGAAPRPPFCWGVLTDAQPCRAWLRCRGAVSPRLELCSGVTRERHQVHDGLG